jgi:hypothetical protein
MYSLQAEVLGFFCLRFRTSDRYDRRDRHDPKGDLWSVTDFRRRHHRALSTTVYCISHPASNPTSRSLFSFGPYIMYITLRYHDLYALALHHITTSHDHHALYVYSKITRNSISLFFSQRCLCSSLHALVYHHIAYSTS